MYIGPWQEYNLSKGGQAPPTQPPQQLKRGLEEAIARSLDPATAQVAIEAVETFFTAQGGQSNVQPRRPQRPAGQNNRRQQRRKHHLPKLSQQSLLEMERSINSARELNYSDSVSSFGTPLSVRSSQSEPMPQVLRNVAVTKLPVISNAASSKILSEPREISGRVQKQLSGLPPMIETSPHNIATNIPSQPLTSPVRIDISHQQSATVDKTYDSSAVVAFLRMERAQKKRIALEKVTGWKMNSSGDNNGESSNQKPRLNPLERVKEKRLEEISLMRQKYAQTVHGATQEVPPTSPRANVVFSDSPSSSWKSLPPIEEIPPTPQVRNLEITEQELNLVSKYFQSSSTASAQEPNRPEHVPSIGVGIAFTSSSPFPGDTYEASNASNVQSNIASDESFVGGIEGLLKWSSQLDLDNI